MMPRKRLLRGRFLTPALVPTPTPSPNPPPIAATVFNAAGLVAAVASAAAGGTIAMAPGDYGSVSLPARTLSPALTIRSADYADPGIFSSANATSALSIANWNGLDIEGVTIRHTNGAGLAGLYALANAEGCQNVAMRRNSFTADAFSSFDFRAIQFSSATGFTIDRNKFSRIRGAQLYCIAGTSITITDNFFANNGGGDCIRLDTSCNGLTMTGNCAQYFEYYGVEHADFLQTFTAGGAYTNINVSNNLVMTVVGFEAQGLFLTFLAGQPNNNITVANNILMGTMNNAIFVRGVTNCSVTGNRLIKQDTGITTPLIHFIGGAVATYGSNIAQILDDPEEGANTLTNAGGGVTTETMSEAQMLVVLAAWRALNPNVPT